VKIKWSTAAIFGVEINFIGLTQRVGLDKVSLIVHVEPMVGRMFFEISNISSNINGGHGFTLPAKGRFAGVEQKVRLAREPCVGHEELLDHSLRPWSGHW